MYKLEYLSLCDWLISLFGEGNGTPLQHSCLANPMAGGAWWATVHGVSKSRTRLSDFHSLGLNSGFSLDFPGGSDGKVSVYNAGDLGSIPGSGRFPGKRNGNPLQYSCPKSHGWRSLVQATVHGVAKSQTRLSDFTFFHFHALEKEMATHSSVLAWRIPGTGEPGGLLSMGSHRVGHD